MKYDPNLADRLSGFTTEVFQGEVFRVTRANADPTAPSLYGGRWARPQNSDPGTAVLYTSLIYEGALAEVTSYLADLTPIPKRGIIKVTSLSVTASKVVRLTENDLTSLGVDMTQYSLREYARTQEIGSTLAWLGVDALIAPSARWPCSNLMIYTENHSYSETLEPIAEEAAEWRSWAESNGILKSK
jgi:hypothetical protein